MPPYNLAENLIDEIADNKFSNTEIQETRLLPYVETNNGMRVQAGELLITGSYEFALAHPYIFPVNDSDTYAQDAAWNEFKERNKYCYVGQSYPEYYYYLFGGWIRGSTLGTSLMPCNYIYYASLQ